MDFGPTLKHLQAFFAPRKVVAKVYQSPELEKAVEQGKDLTSFLQAPDSFIGCNHSGPET